MTDLGAFYNNGDSRTVHYDMCVSSHILLRTHSVLLEVRGHSPVRSIPATRKDDVCGRSRSLRSLRDSHAHTFSRTRRTTWPSPPLD